VIGAQVERLTPAERIGTLLRGELPDRIAYFLNAALHGAGLVGTSIRGLFSDAELAVEGALAVQLRLGNDLVTSFTHAAGEAEAFGGEVLWFDDGPPNAGTPPLTAASLATLRPPPLDHPALALRIELTRALAARVAGRIPVVGALVAPFSLPAMQLGLPAWFDLLHDAPREAERLLAINVEHCIAFGRAQLAAGASVILAFEPLAAPAMTSRAQWRALGLPALERMIAGFGGPCGVSTASTKMGGVAKDFADAGAALLYASEADDLGAVARASDDRAVILGDLNGLKMRTWTPEDVDREIQAFAARVLPRGRVIAAEHHGEVPLQVPFETLVHVAASLRRYGRYEGSGHA
jgi:uroporphyrinogen decarboxylase